MNGRQRIQVALGRGVPDRVPTWDWFDEPVTLGVAEYLGLESHGRITTLRKGDETAESLELYCRVVEALDVDATSNVYNTGLTAVNHEYGEDKYDRGYLLSDNGMPAAVKAAVEDARGFESYDMVSRLEDSDFDGLRYVQERLGDERAHCLNINGPFQEAWNITGGMQNLLIAFVTDPQYANSALRCATDFLLELIDRAADLGVDFLMVDGDICGNEWPLMSPEHWQEFIVPYKREIVARAHSLGLKIVKHSDGQAWSILDDLIEIGFDGFHPIQPQCMDLTQVKWHTWGRIPIFGNVDCLDLLVFGSPEQVGAETKRVIDVASRGGGHILSSSNSLHPGCKPENVVAMFEAARRYGDYTQIPTDLIEPDEAPPIGLPTRRPRRQRRRRASTARA